jgi:hypothetical protein
MADHGTRVRIDRPDVLNALDAASEDDTCRPLARAKFPPHMVVKLSV